MIEQPTFEMEGNEAPFAVDMVAAAEVAFTKSLSANDTGETGGHQSGILIGSTAGIPLLFPDGRPIAPVPSRPIQIEWPQFGLLTDANAKYYPSKGEYRITQVRGATRFPASSDHTGDTLVITRMPSGSYQAALLETESEIDGFRTAYDLSPADTNRLVRLPDPGGREATVLARFAEAWTHEFPSGRQMAVMARDVQQRTSGVEDAGVNDPDRSLIHWVNAEYKLFRVIEEAHLRPRIDLGFPTVDAFIELANAVKNRRASRAGHSLEYHVEGLLRAHGVAYTAQAQVDGRKRPDFIMPSQSAYEDPRYPSSQLRMLAVKTTCKDRWRQVIDEAERINRKHLLTLQRGVTAHQLDAMTDAGIVLVVPRDYHKDYPKSRRDRLMTVASFLEDAPKMDSPA